MYDKGTLPSIVCISGAYYNYQLYTPYFQFPVIRENSKLPDYFITTEWINIKNKSNNEASSSKKGEDRVSLSERSISSNIYKYLSTRISDMILS
jgi:hypothetical protein